MKNISIITLNVGRMATFAKRDATFRHLRSLRADIICIQEHNCAETDRGAWERHWGAKVLWSRHTATLLSSLFVCTHIRIGGEGRILQTDLSFNDTKNITITNMYVPAQPGERAHFLENFTGLQAHPWHLLVGDLNLFPDAILDRCPEGRERTLLPHWQ